MNESENVNEPSDLEYVAHQFVELRELCARRGLSMGEVKKKIDLKSLPSPSYTTADGRNYVPVEYFEMASDQSDFAARMAAAAQLVGLQYTSCEIAEAFEGVLSGDFAVCLKQVTPENIVLKDSVTRQIEALISDPHPDQVNWIENLRSSVNALDALERPFSPNYDRRRFGQAPSRDRLINAIRLQFPKIA